MQSNDISIWTITCPIINKPKLILKYDKYVSLKPYQWDDGKIFSISRDNDGVISIYLK